MAKKPSGYKRALTNFEFKTLKGAILGYMNGDSVASTNYPADVLESIWWRALTDAQKDSIILTLKSNAERLKEKAFGDEQNRIIWNIFMAAIDVSCHYFVELSNGDQVKVFDANDRVYQYDLYMKEPRRPPRYIRKEFINKIL